MLYDMDLSNWFSFSCFSTFGCPYSEINMNKESVLGDRLGMLAKEESMVKHEDHSGSPDSKWDNINSGLKLKQPYKLK